MYVAPHGPRDHGINFDFQLNRSKSLSSPKIRKSSGVQGSKQWFQSMDNPVPVLDNAADSPCLYWTCWICCAAGGYEHNTDFSYAGDVSKLLHADRDFLHQKLSSARLEIAALVHSDSDGHDGNRQTSESSLKDLLRGKGLEHLRGCVTGFGIFRIRSYFEKAMQPLEQEEAVTSLGLRGYVCLLAC